MELRIIFMKMKILCIILVEIEDINSILGNLEDEFDLRDDEINSIYERIDQIYSLKYKYGDDPYEYKRKKENELRELLSKKKEFERLKKDLEKYENEIRKKSDFIHKERIKAKKDFEKKVKEELSSIGMKDVVKQKTAYEIMPSLVGSEMCIRDRG